MHPLAPVGTLFAVTVWPLLAAFLLALTPENRQASSSLTFAVAGLVVTPLAVWLMPGTDALAAACSCIVTAIPLLLPPAQDRTGRILPFLVTGCALLAFNVHSAFAVTVLCGAGAVLLAWREGRGARKAAIVWDMARSRLGGVVLGLLGASLLPMHQSSLGAVLLTVGLCMVAGLGPSPASAPEAAILDTGLRFSALMLMLRLSDYPLVHLLMLIAGFGTLLMLVSSRSSGRAFSLPMLSALGILAAATGEGPALVLLLLAALGLAAIGLAHQDPGGADEENGIAAGSAPWPVFCALVGIGRSLGSGNLALLVVCLLPALWSVRHMTLLPASGREGGHLVLVIQAVLLLGGLCGPLFLAWHPVTGWTP
ncbi:hypothetical protein [Gluconobacter kanchanaburiensis]|uniref:NADH:quinone oxidoreductase/Mrp antiporter membrane subunit domain-containing protein n=1 Tax=Gluconobacter kanchanaburiensis NBRC 103587 TaxID=1307948 RepID=A0A511B612_9PROT|nr:hypothetical protein [Gluconobacter kanchanaburiensis]MBF0861454.1 hypothetical protein [Gluconobacter kanchanaburiensis]GBR68328.1 hypothetical protein AA103587_0749 [Gluconobacter kanchanaburiensis NBRC 103587]GEK95818.1 hypothetical protein GKA01_10150 [Gluconobacter kanchanaburiensis NBRC 103587]